MAEMIEQLENDVEQLQKDVSLLKIDDTLIKEKSLANSSSRNDFLDVSKFVFATMVIALHTVRISLYDNFFSFGYLHMPQRAATSMFF